MTMEVLAAEFPDIWMSGDSDQDYEEGDGGDRGVGWNMFTSSHKTPEDFGYDKMMAVRDTNKNMTYKVAAASTEPPTKYISPRPSVQNLQSYQKNPLLPDLIAATNPVYITSPVHTTSIQSSCSITEETKNIAALSKVQTASENLQPCQKTALLPDLIAATNPVTAITSPIFTTSIQSSSSFIEEESHQSLAKFDDIDDILETLAQLEYNPSTHSQLDLTKSAYGCDWSSSSSTCVHGISCPFITQFLGLADFQKSQADAPPAAPARLHRVVVLRQTPTDLVKLQESSLLLGQGEVTRLQAMTPQEQVRQVRYLQQQQQLGITSTASVLQLRDQTEQFVRPNSDGQQTITPSTTTYTVPLSSQYQATSSHSTGNLLVSATSQDQFLPVPSSEVQFPTLPFPTSQVTSNTNFRSSSVPYRLPPNAVIVKVPISSHQNQPYQFSIPTPSPSPPTPSASLATATPTTAIPLCCSECDDQFYDNKSLLKHTRNQHKVYQCIKCGENTVGYYRMASHTKKNHSKEPAFFCQCGRNFSEKRGMSKHQNTCSFFSQ